MKNKKYKYTVEYKSNDWLETEKDINRYVNECNYEFVNVCDKFLYFRKEIRNKDE